MDITTSDHRPILFGLNVSTYTSNSPVKCIAWNKCTPVLLDNYKGSVAENINILFKRQSCDGVPFPPDYINNSLIEIIHKATKRLPRTKYNMCAKPYWSAEVKTAHAQIRFFRRKWVNDR